MNASIVYRLRFLWVILTLNLVTSTRDGDEVSFKQGNVRNRNIETTSNVQVPFFYGIGQGTTATRTLFRSMCHLNICAVHFKQMCFDVDEAADLTKEQAIAIEGQREVVDLANALSRCAGNRGNSCPIDEALHYLHELEEAVKKVILSGGVHYVADTPYPHMITFILSILKDSNPDSEPVFLMTERDPHDWVIKRMQGHSGDVVCRYYFQMDDVEFENFEEKYPDNNPMDWSHCINFASKIHRVKKPVSASDIFVSLQQLMRETEGNERRLQEVVERATRAYDKYQKIVSKMDHMLFSINLFEQETFLTEDELSNQIYDRMFESDVLSDSVKESLKLAGITVLDPRENRMHGTFKPRWIDDSFSSQVVHMNW